MLIRFLGKKLSSFQIIIVAFLGLILAGAFLLMLPISVRDGHSASLETAIFTSTSAVCVTGLVVRDTALYWSGFGQAVILLLIQIGGLGTEELKLTPIEYKLLCLLAKNTGKVLTHTYITQNIWGRSWENDIASLRVFMVTLRKKLEPSPDSPELIQTHVGIGYRMLKLE